MHKNEWEESKGCEDNQQAVYYLCIRISSFIFKNLKQEISFIRGQIKVGIAAVVSEEYKESGGRLEVRRGS